MSFELRSVSTVALVVAGVAVALVIWVGISPMDFSKNYRETARKRRGVYGFLSRYCFPFAWFDWLFRRRNKRDKGDSP